jgi:low affinity Fe/Cu permease
LSGTWIARDWTIDPLSSPEDRTVTEHEAHPVATAESSPRRAHADSPHTDPKANPPPPPKRREIFGVIAAWTAHATGGRWAFLLALAIVLVWAASGPFFHYSEMWQLVINTGTTIVTFLMVFLIQNAQNRESKAVHLKLDELIRAVTNAKNEIIDIENLPEEQLDRLAERYTKLAARPHRKLEKELEGVKGDVSEVEERVDEVKDQVAKVERKVEETVATRQGVDLPRHPERDAGRGDRMAPSPPGKGPG